MGKLNRPNRILLGFTLIELMIVVAIIAILAAIAIPAYQSYLYNSYLSETTTSFSAIKSAEESFYSLNYCYIEAPWYPQSSPPAGKTAAWTTPATTSPWSQSGLGVRPDSNVHFIYAVYATNTMSASGGCGGTPTSPGAMTAPYDCVADPGALVGLPSGWTWASGSTPSSWAGNNYYIIVARGDLNGNGKASNIISPMDTSSVIGCNQTE